LFSLTKSPIIAMYLLLIESNKNRKNNPMKKQKLLFTIVSMKNLFKLLLTGLAVICTFTSLAQERDTALRTCGVDAAYEISLGDSATVAGAGSRYAAATASATLTCGRFELVFDDVTLGTGFGFDDATLGATRRQCVCDVVNYIQSTFTVPTGDGSQIKILFKQSWSSTYTVGLPSPLTLAVGGGYRTSSTYTAGTAGFYGGNVYDHYTTGNDPDATAIDGEVQVNFVPGYWYCGSALSCTAYDFFGLMLHEFTHAMGWASAIKDNGGGSFASVYNNNNQFSKYDQYFLYQGNVSTGLTKVVTTGATPAFAAGLPSNTFTNNELWMTNVLKNSTTSNQNVPVFSRPGSSPPNSCSHISDWQDIWELAIIAPGFVVDHIMAPNFGYSQTRGQYTPQELRFLNTMGYSFTSAFIGANGYITGNVHPYTTKNVMDPVWLQSSIYRAAEIDMSTYVPADASITNCAGQTATFTLTSDASIDDADNDKIYIYPGSLYNIRGCGNGGNNHSGLSVNTTTNGDIITYTPRTNFIGRAQFGFHLYDGKEKGDFMVYTIDVAGCTACGSNLVINGNFEEGMEILEKALA